MRIIYPRCQQFDSTNGEDKEMKEKGSLKRFDSIDDSCFDVFYLSNCIDSIGPRALIIHTSILMVTFVKFSAGIFIQFSADVFFSVVQFVERHLILNID